ncbi:hypothetical protein PAK_P100033 [Pseudomonas phage PAK_P1]|uniref:Uncharacterized protein n=25 Tax=Viruses TaxID=10239 RepID=V5K339_9CAUD|nr:hypothetical protein X831_gp033 [Pseudomonas phage PAK_P2]YP_008869159.1 hypothetical protein PAK_P100033 [Pseudomonas phage PAK_P1]YP_009047071.1 hypothetical protein PaP1_gp162 [Pseudomonas phage PaP1]YP_009200020.1 hypothetical protein K8_084 [Pseudomonas phage K8]YP_009224774.1 hypothetical protein PaoP5_083 [Pseudomonas phage PaoP5]YP_009273838.1 hypothetical protein BH773_gp145 [Pseudomonas phage K5]YP_009291158.1 hypothetical protein BI047_gp100 [Pseudomonas phage phiMK]YP_00959813
MTRKQDWPLVSAVGALFISLLVCMAILAFTAMTPEARFDSVRQTYEIRISESERRYELKLNRLQDQINSASYTQDRQSRLQYEELDSLKRKISELERRIKEKQE